MGSVALNYCHCGDLGMEHFGNPCSILFWLMPEKPGSKSWCHNSQVLPKKIVSTSRNPKCHWQKERGKSKAVHGNRPQKLLLWGGAKTQQTLQDTARGSAVFQGSRIRGWHRWGCWHTWKTPERKEKKNHNHNRACNHWPHVNITKRTNEVRLNGRCPQPPHAAMWKLGGPRGP